MLIRLSFAFVILLCASFQSSCSSVTCSDEVSSSTIDTNKSPCTSKCDCNNQNYYGVCIDSVCKAFKRADCAAPGQYGSCQTIEDNLDGRWQCQPTYLKAQKWGDCVKSDIQPTKTDCPIDKGCTNDTDCAKGESCHITRRHCTSLCTNQTDCDAFLKKFSNCASLKDNVHCVPSTLVSGALSYCQKK